MSDEKRIVKPISMNRIRKLKALCRKATPAPWKDIRHSIQSEDGYEIGGTYRVESQKDTICHLDSYLGCPENEKADAAFIAAARQAVPDLLAEVERLRAEKEVLEEALDSLGDFIRYQLDYCAGDFVGEGIDHAPCELEDNPEEDNHRCLVNCWAEAFKKQAENEVRAMKEEEDGNHE